MNKSEMITELEISMQQKDTLEVELLARTRENRILKNRLQELIDYGEGLDVKMPGQWSLEEQTTALRFMLKAAREEVMVEGKGKIIFDGKDLPNLARLAFTENEEQWREVRRLERKVAELTKHLDTLREERGGKVNYFGSNSNDTINYPASAADVPKGSAGKDSARMIDVNGEREVESDKSRKHVVTSSKAKLKKNSLCSDSKSEYTLQNSGKPVDQLTDEEFCDLQIRSLEAAHELRQQEQLVVEEVTSKFNETDTSENMLSYKEEMGQPCQINLTGPSCGPTPGAVGRYSRKYDGVSKIRVEEDGGVEVIDDRSDAKDETPVANVEEELKSSVAVRVRRRGGN